MKTFVLLLICSVAYLWWQPESEPVVNNDYRFYSVPVVDTTGTYHDDFDSTYFMYGCEYHTFTLNHKYNE